LSSTRKLRDEGGSARIGFVAALCLIAGLCEAATGSHLLSVLGASSWADTTELELSVVGAVYVGFALLGVILGLGVVGAVPRLGGDLGPRLERSVIAGLLALCLGLYAIAYVWGGDDCGLFVVGLLDASLGYAIPLVFLGPILAFGWVVGARERAARPLALAASLIVASALVSDAWNLIRFAATKNALATRRFVSEPMALEPEDGQALGSRAPAHSIVHVVFDAMSAELMERDPELSRAAFFEHAESGTYFRRAYTNAIATEAAVPQLLTGRFSAEDPWQGSVLSEARRAGLDSRLYLATGPLACEPGRATSCQWFATMWADEVFAGDRRAYLRYQVEKLGRIYLTRFLGSAIHALYRWDAKPKAADLAHQARPLSILLFERMLEDLRSETRPTYYFAHLVLPHAPLLLDAQCRVKQGFGGLASYKVPGSSPEYREQMQCANRLAIELIDTLRELGRYDQTQLILQSDHGPRGDLVAVMKRLGARPGPIPEADSAAIERAARMLLWIKPARAGPRTEDDGQLELVQLTQRIRELIGLETGADAAKVQGCANGALTLRGLDLLAEDLPARWLCRDPAGGWSLELPHDAATRADLIPGS